MLGRIYAITDSTLLPTTEALLKGVTSALNAGIRTVQYRDKSSSSNMRRTQALALLKLCDDHAAQLIINDDVDLASSIGAHGVHLGQQDTRLIEARKRLGSRSIIGITCHGQLALAEDAVANGADYVAFGRFFPSSTKEIAPQAPLSVLSTAKRTLNTPVVAIGGLTEENVQAVFAQGADTAAVCHALFHNTNIYKMAQSLIKRSQSTHKETSKQL